MLTGVGIEETRYDWTEKVLASQARAGNQGGPGSQIEFHAQTEVGATAAAL